MTLDELYELLYNAIQDNSIILSSELRPELGFVLQALGISPSLTVNNIVLSPPTASEVVLQGSALYRENNCNATLTGKVQGEGYTFRLDLEVSVQNSWTLGSAFNNLPDTYIAQDATLARTTSYLYSTNITQPAFSASNPPPGMEDAAPAAGFTGYLNMDGLLNQYVDFLGSGPFPLEGTVLIINQNFPILSLKADIAGKSIDLGNSSIGGIFLRLSTHAESDALPAAYSGSTLEIVGSVAVGSTSPVTMDISAILLQGNIRWVFDGKFEDYTEKLAQGLEPLAELLNTTVAGLVAPPAIKALTSFYLKDIRVSIIPPDFSKGRFLPGIDFISGTVMTKDGWLPSIPFINISNVGVRWMINTFSTGSFISSCVFGNVTFGTAPHDTTFLINACLPDFIIQCTLAKDNEFDLGQVFGWFYGGSGPSTGLKVTDLRFVADPQQKTFKFQANMTTGYSLTFGKVTFSLEEMDLWVYYRQNNVSGGIRGTMLIQSKDYTPDNPQYLMDTGLWLVASYDEDGAWFFEGGLIPGTTLDLVTLIAQFLGVDTPPDGLPVSVTIEELVTSFDTGTKTYTLSGSVVGRLKLTNVLGNLDLSLTANVDIARLPKTSDSQFALMADNDNMVLVGSIFGKFAVNKFYVGVGINLKETESTYIFTIGYDKLSLTGTTAWIGDEQNRHQIINFTLQGITLGSMIEFFVNLARPGSDYRLNPPWDFLNSIDLSKFTLTVDPKDSWVSLTYAVNLDLFFIDIKTVGLKYIKVNGQDSVRLVLTGRFLDEDYTEGNELNWDVIDDPPPAVPGEGEQLLRLRYLGLGQHIMLQNSASFNSVSDVINALRDQMKPIADTSKNPLAQPSGSLLTFNENSHWLIGLDVTIMDMLSIAAVFNDPNIYGLVVSLSGPNAGSLAGFRFEIIYKRITDDIGVYKAVFRMPEAFRQLQFGVVSITLGVVSVEIYTNGDFKVDLGFPKNGDFTDSFCLQVYIFIGHGGIYFGKLNGTTSSRVPVITNGTFSPVLELGIGLAVGVGREFSAGPLKAGLYVEMLAIFEGVLAWFHPNDAAQKTEMYYWARAVAGLIGKLYGCVDFKVIKVSISVEAYATVTLVLESYQSTIVELDVGVEVKASVKILFVKVNFSFGINIHESFTIGEKGTPPWITSASGAGQPSNQLTANVHRPRRRSHFETRALSHLDNNGKVLGHKSFLCDSMADEDYNLIWNSIPVFLDGQTHNILLKLIPAFTIDNIGVQWPESTANGTPSYKIIFMLTADNGVSADAVEHTDVRK
ncbi:MAG TPA: hypothetical protein VHT34_10690, partial [Clostridia bacterium]|nr:hypothetical protein [Clostridia bacterium]